MLNRYVRPVVQDIHCAKSISTASEKQNWEPVARPNQRKTNSQRNWEFVATKQRDPNGLASGSNNLWSVQKLISSGTETRLSQHTLGLTTYDLGILGTRKPVNPTRRADSSFQMYHARLDKYSTSDRRSSISGELQVERNFLSQIDAKNRACRRQTIKF